MRRSVMFSGWRAGFRREGYQRARLSGPDGTRVDDILYARLRTDPDS